MNRVTLNMPRESPFVPLLSIAPSLSPTTLLHELLAIPPMRRVTSPPDPNKGYLGFERKTTYKIRPNSSVRRERPNGLNMKGKSSLAEWKGK
ncbi:hypothetical protein Tco_1207416 [Tanacetum coccineum]